LDVKKIVHDLFKEGRDAESIPTADEIVENISGHLKPGDLVCIMSSGGFGGLHEKILKRLSE
jgi:UDP-N-acetylmuramate: L-alanyl-gamma-D-glutamyl-meso-diaminopimelate ligase